MFCALPGLCPPSPSSKTFYTSQRYVHFILPARQRTQVCMSFLARCLGLFVVGGGERCRGGRERCSDSEEEGEEDEGRLGSLRRVLSETAPPRTADFALVGMARAAAGS